MMIDGTSGQNISAAVVASVKATSPESHSGVGALYHSSLRAAPSPILPFLAFR